MEVSQVRGALQTRQPAIQSSEKRGSAALSKVAVYRNPLPLSQHPKLHHEGAARFYAIVWTILTSARTLLNTSNALGSGAEAGRRNPIPQEAYMSERLVGFWDEASRSVWVMPHASKRSVKNNGKDNENEQDNITQDISSEMQKLWVRGFFGKGSLSRSEPTWWQREKNRVTGAYGEFSAHLTFCNNLLKPADRPIRICTYLVCVTSTCSTTYSYYCRRCNEAAEG